MTNTDSDESAVRRAVLLDYMPHGRADDDRPQYQKPPLAYAVGEEDFELFEIVFEEDADAAIGDTVVTEPREDREEIDRLRTVEYGDLSGGAQSELEYVIEEIVTENEQRFVDFYNDAQPITLRLHQLNLLPGIGKKLRNNVLDERKRGRFEGFDDLEERIAGLHDPKGVLAERILEEIRDEDLKYRAFVGRDDADA
jgi:putative nucleotide binding protein